MVLTLIPPIKHAQSSRLRKVNKSSVVEFCLSHKDVYISVQSHRFVVLFPWTKKKLNVICCCRFALGGVAVLGLYPVGGDTTVGPNPMWSAAQRRQWRQCFSVWLSSSRLHSGEHKGTRRPSKKDFQHTWQGYSPVCASIAASGSSLQLRPFQSFKKKNK